MRQEPEVPNAIDRDRILTKEEVAKRLGITVAKAHQLIQRRRLPVVKIAGKNCVRESDLTAFIAGLLLATPKGRPRLPALPEHNGRTAP